MKARLFYHFKKINDKEFQIEIIVFNKRNKKLLHKIVDIDERTISRAGSIDNWSQEINEIPF